MEYDYISISFVEQLYVSMATLGVPTHNLATFCRATIHHHTVPDKSASAVNLPKMAAIYSLRSFLITLSSYLL